jgi:uridine kinase
MEEIGRIVKRDGSAVPFDPERITVAIYKAFASLGRHDRSEAERLASEVVAVLAGGYTPEAPPTVEDIQDVVENVLIRNGHAEAAKAYIIYRFQRAEVRQRRAGTGRKAEEHIPYKVLWRYYIWNVEHGTETTEKLSRIVRQGGLGDLVRASDLRYEHQIDRAAEEIAQNRDEVRLVIIAGPSSSGKTTTTIKLGQRLAKSGLSLRTLNVDNYFFDLSLHPRDAWGDYDFETPEALDLNLVNDHLVRLLAGETVETPVYNFKTGRREERTTPFSLGENDVLLLDCLHGLYDAMTGAIPAERKFRIYTETLEQIKTRDGEFIRWTDIRLLRRMIRDHLHRAYDPRKTLMHWHYVRRSEMKHIIPFVNDVDFVLNSALPYELPVLKGLLFDRFPAFLDEFRDSPAHADAFLRATRIGRTLEELESVTDTSLVPSDSLLREFIGGSSLAY